MKLVRYALASSVFLIALPAAALQLGDEDQLLSIEIHGFASPGMMLSTNGNNYLAETTRPSFEFVELGLNFTKQLTDKLRFGFQLFSRQLGPTGGYTPKADWFYIDYRFRDWLGLRAGRVKLPFGLYNEVNDIDAARVPVLLPQSVYPTQNRDFLLAQTGAELYGYLRMGGGGALDYRLYGGSVFIDLPAQPSSPVVVLNLHTPYIFGARLLWETPLEGLRIGGSAQYLELDTQILYTAPPPPTTLNAQIQALLWVASVEYAAHDVLIAAEYSRWHLRTHSSDSALLAPGYAASERAYIMASYRVLPWFVPGVYYSLYFPDATKHFTSRSSDQHDIAATLRFDIIEDHWLIKLEAHYMHGTAVLQPSQNHNVPLNSLAPDWAFFLLKTTGYF